MGFKMKGFSPFTQNDDETKYYAKPGGMLPEVELTAKHTNKSRRLAKDRETLAELHKNPVIKAIHGKTEKAASQIRTGAENLAVMTPIGRTFKTTATGVKALKSSPKMQRMLKAWSDKASKAFKAWKKGPGKKMWKKAQDIPTVSSSEFPKGYYKWRGKMYKGTYPKGTEVKGGGGRLKWDQHTMKWKNK